MGNVVEKNPFLMLELRSLPFLIEIDYPHIDASPFFSHLYYILKKTLKKSLEEFLHIKNNNYLENPMMNLLFWFKF